jgi:hypothetical protein
MSDNCPLYPSPPSTKKLKLKKIPAKSNEQLRITKIYIRYLIILKRVRITIKNQSIFYRQ